MSPFMFSRACESRNSPFPNHQNQPSPMGCTSSLLNAQAAHRRALPERMNDHYRHKLLPRLPHEVEAYRSWSLLELTLEISRPKNRPLPRYAPEVPLCKSRSLPWPPQRPREPADREKATVETDCVVDLDLFFLCWSKDLLLTCENVGSWEEKLTFAREMQDFWTKRELVAHEVQDCACDCACACGMI